MDMRHIARVALSRLVLCGMPMLLRSRELAPFPENGRYPETWTEHAFHGLRVNPGSRELPGVLLQADDQLILADAVSLPEAPRPGDVVLTGGERPGQWNDSRNNDMNSQQWRVETVFAVKPGSIVVLYKLLVRRA